MSTAERRRRRRKTGRMKKKQGKTRRKKKMVTMLRKRRGWSRWFPFEGHTLNLLFSRRCRFFFFFLVVSHSFIPCTTNDNAVHKHITCTAHTHTDRQTNRQAHRKKTDTQASRFTDRQEIHINIDRQTQKKIDARTHADKHEDTDWQTYSVDKSHILARTCSSWMWLLWHYAE